METKPRPLIVAHRGGAICKALENTLEAFERAFALDSDAIEGDFHLTSDNHIICYHDYTIQNLTIKNSTLSELHSLNPNLPTLKAVLSLIPKDKMIYIEIKCGIEIFEYLVPIIQSSNLLHTQIVIISFDAEVIHQSKVTYPNIKAYWLYTFNRDKEIDFKRLKKVLDVSKADGISTNFTSAVNRAFINRLKEYGYTHHAWTINNANNAVLLSEWGTLSITTDKVEEIRKSLAK